MHHRYLDQAIDIALHNVVGQTGGPFGAIIVKNNSIIATGKNRVTSSNDPTAHAEIDAIRNACRISHTHKLNGMILYCNCQPCPMCLAAIYWARLAAVYYASPQQHAVEAGFDDAAINKFIQNQKPNNNTPIIQQLTRPTQKQPFDAWSKNSKKVCY